MARKARCPARICQVGSSAAPIDCAIPSTMPPINVPHMLPSPPIITASKARMSRIGPDEGAKIVRMHTGKGGENHGDAERERVKLAVIDAHELGGIGVVGNRAESAAKPRAVEQELEARDGKHRHRKNQQRINADIKAAGLQAGGLDRAFFEPMVVSAEALQQPVLDYDRDAESDEQRR